MLVLQRLKDETVEIGSCDTVMVALTAAEVAAIKEVARTAAGAGIYGLACRLGESKAGPIEVTLVDVRDNYRARIGFEAPKGIPVHRKEVAEQIRREKRAAAA